MKGAEATRAGDSAASEPSTKAIDKANDSIIVMASENTTIATDVQGAAEATTAVSETATNEVIATIINVQEYQGRYFFELSTSFEGRDEKGNKTTTNTISKGARSILGVIKSPLAKVIQAKTNGRPEDYNICSLIGLLTIGGEIRFTRTLVAAGDPIPESDRRATAECFATKLQSIKVDCGDVMPFIMEGIKTIEKREKDIGNPFAI